MSQRMSNTQEQISETPDTDQLFEKLKKNVRPIYMVARKNLKSRKRTKKRRIYLNGILGFGGIAVVAKGRMNISLDRRELEDILCAVKIIYPGRTYGPDINENEANRTRFNNEYYSMLQVYTNLEKLEPGLEKHLVRPYRLGEFDTLSREKDIDMGRIWTIREIAKKYRKRPISWRYIASEYVDGKDLGQYMGKISIKELIKLGKIICRVLEVTHDQKLIHRDIKPANILIPNRKTLSEGIEYLKLTDFGLSKRLDIGVPFYSCIIGSVGHSAPEQMDPKSLYPVDGRADIYGICASIYSMATGHRAYNENDIKLLIGKDNKMISRPPPITEYVHQPGLEGLSEVLDIGLSPYRGKRYGTTNELERALDSADKRL